MAISDVELTEAWKEVLTLSKLKRGELVTFLTSDASNPQLINTCRIAAGLMGGIITILNVHPVNGGKALSRDTSGYVGVSPIAGNRAAIEALKHSDLVIDMMMLLFSPEQQEVLKAKTRVLLAVEPPEVLLRMMPKLEDKKRAQIAGARLGRAKSMTVTSAAGTDFHCNLGQYSVIKQHGFVDEPGAWDHWPGCFVYTWPNEGESEGTIVIDEGDILLPLKRYARGPVKLTIEKGYIRRVDGGFDADFIKCYLDSFDDPESYAMAHVGWGLHPRANWTTLGVYNPEGTQGMDARAYQGNFLFSTGPNTEVGGKRNTPSHLDIPLRGCSLSLDGEAITVDGKLVAADQL